MSSTRNEEPGMDKERDEFIAGMKTRIEQAQSSGQSPEQIREEAEAYAHEKASQQAPKVAAKALSCWVGFRNFIIVGALAFGLAIGLALYVDHTYASPLCEKYAELHSLVYRGLEYPVIGESSSTTSSGSCIFNDASGQRNTVDFRHLEPNVGIALLASFALQIDFTVPALFVVIALIAVGISKLR